MSKVSQQVINAFSETAVQVLQSFMTETTPKKIVEDQETQGDISSVIKLTDFQKNTVIILVLYFSENIARNIYGKLFGEGTGGIKDICNLIAEIANIIVGNVKEKIVPYHEEILHLIHGDDLAKFAADPKIHFEIDIPTTIVGNQHMVFSATSEFAAKIAIPFSGETDPMFIMELTLQKRSYK
jgi:CheY-specific phosphatase CheX